MRADSTAMKLTLALLATSALAAAAVWIAGRDDRAFFAACAGPCWLDHGPERGEFLRRGALFTLISCVSGSFGLRARGRREITLWMAAGAGAWIFQVASVAGWAHAAWQWNLASSEPKLPWLHTLLHGSTTQSQLGLCALLLICPGSLLLKLRRSVRAASALRAP